MPTIGELVLELSADVKGLRKDLAEAQAATKGYGKKTESSLKKTGAAFNKYGGIAGAALIGVMGAAIKTTGDFEKSMQNVSTLISGDATKSIEGLEKGIRQLSRELPKTPNELGASAYDIYSAGITDTSDALNVLRQSARLSIAGLGSQASAVDLMTSAINAFGLEAEDAEEVANILFTTVKVGKTTVEEMTRQFGNTASAAAQAGVSLQDMQAQLAALTAVGVPTSQAQTRLTQAFNQTTKEGTKFHKAMKKSGTSMKEFRKEIKEKGFVKALENVRDSMRKKGETMEDLNIRFKGLLESTEAQGVLFSLLTAAGPAYIKAMKEMGMGTDDFRGAVVKASKGFNQSMINMQGAWQNLANALAKSGAIDATTGFINDLAEAIDEFTELAEEKGGFVDAMMAAIVGTGKELARTLGIIDEVQDKMAAQKMANEAANATRSIHDVARETKELNTTFDELKRLKPEAIKMGIDVKQFEDIPDIRAELDLLKQAMYFKAKGDPELLKEVVSLFENVNKTTDVGLKKVTATTDAELKANAEKYTAFADTIVGHSIVPKMIDAIGEQFDRLESEMGDPTKSATDSVVDMFEGMATAFEGFSSSIGTGDVSFSDLVSEFADLGDAVKTLGETAPILSEQWSTMTSTITTTTADMTAQSSASAMDMQSQVSNAMQQMVSQSSSAIDRLIQKIEALIQQFRRMAQEARKAADSVSVKSSIPEMQEKATPPLEKMQDDLKGVQDEMAAVTQAGEKMRKLAGGAGVTPDLPIPAIDDPRKKNAASQVYQGSKATARATVDLIKMAEEARLSLLDTERRAFEEEKIRWAAEKSRFEENFKLMTQENQVLAEQMGLREDLEAAHLLRLSELDTEFRSTNKELWSAYWMEIVEDETAWLDVATSAFEEFSQGWTDIAAQGIVDAANGVKGNSQKMVNAFAGLFGGIAKSMGEFYIASGAAKIAASFFPPSPGLATAGSLEIAAGLGLKVLGAALGGVGKGGGASKGAGGGAAYVPSTPGTSGFGDGEDDPIRRGDFDFIVDVGRLKGKKVLIDDLDIFVDDLFERFRQRGNLGIEVTQEGIT